MTIHEFVNGTLVPGIILDIDAEINRLYPNLRVAHIPAEARADHSASKPFALVDEIGGFVIKELTEAEASNETFLLRWLWENDSKRHDPRDLYDKFQKQVKAEEKARLAPMKEKFHEEIEIVSSMARSPLHTYKLPKELGSRKIT
jgi:hypothetical protein